MKKKSLFNKPESYEAINRHIFNFYLNQLVNIASSRFEWVNMPDTVDTRFLEYILLYDGMALFFEDEELGYLTLQTMIGGELNQYRIPVEREAYSQNNYHIRRTNKNSVIIFNNYSHTNSIWDLEIFADRLGNLHRTIDINVNAQKTPIIINCPENRRLTLINLFKRYIGNSPLICTDKNSINLKDISTLDIHAPYVSGDIYELQKKIMEDIMDYLGIYTVANKKERMLVDEVERSQGIADSFRWGYLEMRKQACREINEMFGLNIDVRYREKEEVNTSNE